VRETGGIRTAMWGMKIYRDIFRIPAGFIV